MESPIIVDAAIERKLKFSLRVSTYQTTTVSVTGQSPVIEATKSQLSGTVQSDAIIELPTAGNTTILAELMPGVAQNNPGVCCSLYAVNGSSERSDRSAIFNKATNKAVLDEPEPIQLPAEDVQEYHLITNNYSAEFGRNSGSVAQFITKSGSNRFHGIETWTYNGPSLNAFMSEQRAYNSYIAAGYTSGIAERKARAGFENNTMLFSVGGPIQRDKTFFASFDEWISATSAQPTTTAITARAWHCCKQINLPSPLVAVLLPAARPTHCQHTYQRGEPCRNPTQRRSADHSPGPLQCGFDRGHRLQAEADIAGSEDLTASSPRATTYLCVT